MPSLGTPKSPHGPGCARFGTAELPLGPVVGGYHSAGCCAQHPTPREGSEECQRQGNQGIPSPGRSWVVQSLQINSSTAALHPSLPSPSHQPFPRAHPRVSSTRLAAEDRGLCRMWKSLPWKCRGGRWHQDPALPRKGPGVAGTFPNDPFPSII